MPKPVMVKTFFSLAAPAAAKVELAGDFTNWLESPIPLKKVRGGPWKVTLMLAPGRYEYRYLVDGQWANDPAESGSVPNGFGTFNQVVLVPASS